jgi:hypothetical protein
MNGLVTCATATADPSGLKATLCPLLAGSVAGSEYLVPNPEPDQGYADTNGVVLCATAIADPSGLKATPLPVLAGSVAGLVYLAPNPEPDQEYADMNGVRE